MKVMLVSLVALVALAAARPADDIIDIEEDHLEHEQEGIPGTAVEGEYTWVAPDGNEYVVKYVADHLGFRVIEDNVVPKMRALEVAEEEDSEEDVPTLRAAEEEEEEEDDD